MPLDKTNNASYAYLRSKGNNWTYNPELVHEKLVKRLYSRFDTYDLNNDDVMTLTEVQKWPERMRMLASATDAEIDSMKAAIKITFQAFGVDENHGIKRENWVEANQAFGEAERERERRGEPSLIAALSDAYLDVIDKNDDKCVGFEELKTMMKAFNVPEDSADTFFDRADVNKDGRLDRDEMQKLFKKFWIEKYDPTYDGLYANKF